MEPPTNTYNSIALKEAHPACDVGVARKEAMNAPVGRADAVRSVRAKVVCLRWRKQRDGRIERPCSIGAARGGSRSAYTQRRISTICKATSCNGDIARARNRGIESSRRCRDISDPISNERRRRARELEKRYVASIKR